MFEFDPEKSKKNKTKHGISFEEAQRLWDDPGLIFIRAKHVSEEERFAYIVVINGKYWTAITTQRNSNIRLISCRRARDQERSTYENVNQS